VTTAYRFTLYVTGANPRSATAVEHLRRICEERLSPGEYEIEVVDASDAVEEANAARILVTPTVVRTEPPPVVRVLGDLSATTKIADALGLPGPAPC
jgi:circadian clock protein KaiB